MSGGDPASAPLTRDEAQRRVDRIRAFREEVRALEREGALVLAADDRARVEGHHDALLAALRSRFGVGGSDEEVRLSLGMRIAWLVGALALAAAGYYFCYRFWGEMDVPLQASLLVFSPLVLLAGMEVAARRDRTLHVTGVLGVLGVAAAVLNLSLLAGLLNVAVPPWSMLVWSVFAGALAYAYGLRLLLVGAILFLMGFTATLAGPVDGCCVWDAFGRRPEDFLPVGVALYALPLLVRHDGLPAFPGVYRALGLLCLFVPMLILTFAGDGSYLPFATDRTEVGYQVLCFVLAGLAAWRGIRMGERETTNLGTAFLVVVVYVKFFQWWWDWMPKWVFFLLLAGIAAALLFLLRRLHASLRRADA